jgi:hypothetical protein
VPAAAGVSIRGAPCCGSGLRQAEKPGGGRCRGPRLEVMVRRRSRSVRAAPRRTNSSAEAVGLVGADEVRDAAPEVVDDASIHRDLDPLLEVDAALVEPGLPRVGHREHHVAAHELGPVEAVPVRRGEQPGAIPALLVEPIRPLEDRDPRPVDGIRVDTSSRWRDSSVVRRPSSSTGEKRSRRRPTPVARMPRHAHRHAWACVNATSRWHHAPGRRVLRAQAAQWQELDLDVGTGRSGRPGRPCAQGRGSWPGSSAATGGPCARPALEHRPDPGTSAPILDQPDLHLRPGRAGRDLPDARHPVVLLLSHSRHDHGLGRAGRTASMACSGSERRGVVPVGGRPPHHVQQRPRPRWYWGLSCAARAAGPVHEPGVVRIDRKYGPGCARPSRWGSSVTRPGPDW